MVDDRYTIQIHHGTVGTTNLTLSYALDVLLCLTNCLRQHSREPLAVLTDST